MQPLGFFMVSVDNPASLLRYNYAVVYKLILNYVQICYDRAQHFRSPFSYILQRPRYLASDRYAKYHDQRVLVSVCLFVCLSVCPLACLKNHVQIAVARSSSDDSAIRYILPVLCMTSCFHVMWPMGQNQRRHMFRLVR